MNSLIIRRKALLIHTDGGARGNPGPAAVGVVIKNENQELIHQFGKCIGETTNNVAEYTAVIKALEWIKNNLTSEQLNNLTISFFLDSNLVVNQLNGLFKINKSNLKDLMWQVRELEGELGKPVSYSYVPREENREADKLVNNALDNVSHPLVC